MIRGLFDFHAGGTVSEVRVDVPRYLDQVRRMGIGTLAFMAKDATGLSYYATRVGRRNPRVTGDLLGAAIAAAHRRKIRLLAYFNVALDDFLGVEHPDWRQVDAAGRAELEFVYYTPLCLNSPYRDIVRAQIEELAGRYETDGLWLDITYVFPGRCHCGHCRRRFRGRYGEEMPDAPEPGSPAMARLLEFRRLTRLDFISDFAAAVRRIRGPEFPVVWNHAHDIDFCQVEVDRLASLGACEFHAPEFDLGFWKSDWMRPAGKPFELMMPECLSGWGEWTVSPVATLKTMGAIALAAGASLNLGHVALPSGPLAGRVARPVVDHYAAMTRWLRRRHAWCKGASAVPCAALLTSVANQRLLGCLNGAAYDPAPASVRGLHRMLLDLHRPVDILCEEQAEALPRYEAAVLPEMLHVPEGLAEALRVYVRAGGTLVVEGRSGRLDAAGKPLDESVLADLTGLRTAGACELTSRYLTGLPAALSCNLPDMPLLVRSPAGFVNGSAVAGCQTLATFMDPEFEGIPGRHVYHQQGHPAVATSWPAITVNPCGKGRVVTLLAPVGAAFRASGHPWLRNLLGNLLAAFVPDPLLRVDAPPSVRVTAMKKGDTLFVHVVHWHLEPRMSGPAFVEHEAPVAGIRLSVRWPGSATVRQIANTERPRSYRRQGNRIEIALAPVRTHALIAILP